MTNDIFLVLGIVTLAFSIPALAGAFTEGRPPRGAAIIILLGGGLIAIALTQEPKGYAFEDVPDVFVRVIGHFLRQ